jgi:hypothetical protein
MSYMDRESGSVKVILLQRSTTFVTAADAIVKPM